jgi:hypothetical protein
MEVVKVDKYETDTSDEEIVELTDFRRKRKLHNQTRC